MTDNLMKKDTPLADLVGKDVYTYATSYVISLKSSVPVNIRPDRLLSVTPAGSVVTLERGGRVDLRQSQDVHIVARSDERIHKAYECQEAQKDQRRKQGEERQAREAELRSKLLAFLNDGRGDIDSLSRAFDVFRIDGIDD